VNKNNRKGFTLAELLIVVAIIAVLVAISIPIFHAQLRKARLAANQANGRAAFSAAEAAYLDYVAEHGSIKVNRFAKEQNYQNATYTYFPAAGKGILNFHYDSGDNRWIIGGAGKLNTNIDVSSWTVRIQSKIDA
jgi:prepilin-type N-terminal cleavage/methylation domain-containing protein